ncbi:MAG: alkaline phosphatase family protein [Chitinophagaceae bacterium]|nr:alkaline phosphatase family protein [Chitinophagaceae bacterium]
MKRNWISFLILASLITPGFKPHPKKPVVPQKPVQHLILITTDGFRWQEMFKGADPDLLQDPDYTPQGETLSWLYDGDTPEERRERLMPFFWRVIAKQGQLYGNRQHNNKVNTANAYSISYPGYNEILTGNTDLGIFSNGKKNNPNRNILEYMNSQPEFEGKVAAFSSWDVFPHILNEKRSKLPINSGYDSLSLATETSAYLNRLQEEGIYKKEHTRHDRLTFIAAKEYMAEKHPRFVFLGLGETDEFAHQGRYDLYLQQANEFDRMVGELWHWIQTTPEYKDNTTLIITTDHGRGQRDARWTGHGLHIKGSSQTWLAMLGPNIPALGEVKEEQQIWQKDVAGLAVGMMQGK